VRKREKNSSSKARARRHYEESDSAIREIAKTVRVDEKTVRNWANAEGWTRYSAELPQQVREPAEINDPKEASAPSRAASEIARDFCGTMDVLRAEIDTAVRNLHLVREIVDANLDDPGEKASTARRRLVAKVLELPGLVKASNDLTAALSRLADVGPGKKEEAKDRAKAAGTGRFATPQAPKLVNETLQ
jgi:transposase-like protein